MDANTYQSLAWETAKPFYKEEAGGSTFKDLQLATGILALAGEAGELANKAKKMLERGGGVTLNQKDIDILQDELGDVQWYVAHVASLLNISLEGVMGQNVAKLRERYKDTLTHRQIAGGR